MPPRGQKVVKVKCLAQASHTVMDKWAANALHCRDLDHDMIGEYSSNNQAENTQPTLDTTCRLSRLVSKSGLMPNPNPMVEICCYGDGEQMDIRCSGIGVGAEVAL